MFSNIISGRNSPAYSNSALRVCKECWRLPVGESSGGSKLLVFHRHLAVTSDSSKGKHVESS